MTVTVATTVTAALTAVVATAVTSQLIPAVAAVAASIGFAAAWCCLCDQCVAQYGLCFSAAAQAGSENVGRSQSNEDGARLQEAKNINKSLLGLGKCITHLARSSGGVIPYRDSVLTWILKDALGGNAHTLMLCAVDPAPENAEQTLTTLRCARKCHRSLAARRLGACATSTTRPARFDDGRACCRSGMQIRRRRS